MEKRRILGLVTAAGLVQHVTQPVSYIAEHVSYLDASRWYSDFGMAPAGSKEGSIHAPASEDGAITPPTAAENA
jgi:hypothetical protein